VLLTVRTVGEYCIWKLYLLIVRITRTHKQNEEAKRHDLPEVSHVMTAGRSVGHPWCRALPGTSNDFKIDRGHNSQDWESGQGGRAAVSRTAIAPVRGPGMVPVTDC
jgi:hypothetical protein